MNVYKVGSKTKERITIFTPLALIGRLWNDGELTARGHCLAVTSRVHLAEPSQTSFVVHDKDQPLGPDTVWGSMISIPWLLWSPRGQWPICTAWIVSLALLRPVASELMCLHMAFANIVLCCPFLGESQFFQICIDLEAPLPEWDSCVTPCSWHKTHVDWFILHWWLISLMTSTSCHFSVLFHPNQHKPCHSLDWYWHMSKARADELWVILEQPSSSKESKWSGRS